MGLLDRIQSEKLSARALCKDIGIVNRVLRLFDALAVADEKGVLAEVRKAAAGE